MVGSSPEIPGPRARSVGRLEVTVAATPDNVRGLRREVQTWLRTMVQDEDVVEDLTLALSEALENAVDHAYRGLGTPGDVQVSGHWAHPTVTLTVRDRGRWRTRDTGPTTRGRGLDLIRQLVPDARVDAAAHGTSVVLLHHVA